MKLGERKTHCKRGHEYTPDNTIINSMGRRKCRICDIVRRNSPDAKARGAAYHKIYCRKPENKIKKQEYDRGYRKENRPKLNERSKQFRDDNPEYIRDQWLRRTFNKTLIEWNATFELQGHACLVCEKQKTDNSGWHTDHDHSCCSGTRSCGKCVRGILCGPCNKGLGHFNDDVVRIRRAADYIEQKRKELYGNDLRFAQG